MKRSFHVSVTQNLVITIDDSKFTEEFLAEFRESFYPFTTIDQHIDHLAQLAARGIVGDFGERFIEGYGPAADIGFEFKVIDTDVTRDK